MPGQRIGEIVLNDNLDKVIKRLGKPDSADAAMGASLSTWFSNHNPHSNRLDIYAHRNFGSTDENVSHIKLIRVMSPAFKTKEGISTGNTLNAVQHAYTVRHIADYTSSHDTIKVYDDIKCGLAFEINKDSCIAILVHAPNDSASTYIALHPGMNTGK